ncbi:adenylyl-sulfate kinase [Paenibacillus xylanilyticus]|uniref:Adenylyl-sulfate kinase n=1 Tax=Paenibacillus xylanilyticus TaxID=248903 RepID=A0A7Y6EZF0_9BACL|nr:adenylyl-sulfate kinase [Paenibacillus xylanilyticus]NUU79838.1 adenylyl-sulfate kinase [Paenibacillus xylanilyticus]
MARRLILVEGLPGSGKSTIAKMVSDILIQQGLQVQLFQEGNLDHPADYEGVAFYAAEEFEDLLSTHEACRGILESGATTYHNGYLIPYRKIKEERGQDFPDDVVQEIFSRDIYELPFEQNVDLITAKWRSFAESVLSAPDDSITIFECCFIQNPLTIGLVKCNQSREDNMQYVLDLERITAPLNPLLIYIHQQDIAYTFDKAVKERPKEWSDGFIHYYTNQGLGNSKGYQGIEGTVEVLQARKELETEIYHMLKIDKHWLDNSDYNLVACREELEGILREAF